MKGFQLFRHFFKGYGHIYIGGTILLIIINALFLLVPQWMGEAINTLYEGKDGIWHYVYLFIALGIVVTILKYISRHLLLGSIRKFEFLLRRKLFHHALHIPTSYYEEHGPGKVMALMTNDVTSLRVSLGLGVMIFIDAIFFGIVSFIMISQKMSLSIALLCVAPMPFIAYAMMRLSNSLRQRQKEAQLSYSDVTEYAQELFLGMSIIRAFNKEYSVWRRFTSVNTVNFNNNMEVAKLDALLTPLTFMAPFFCYAINMYICGQAIIDGHMTVGEFVAINGYLMLVIGPVMGIGSLAAVLQKGLASLDRMNEFLAIPEEMVDAEDCPRPLEDLWIRHLTFTYENTKNPALQDITMNIPKGMKVGLVGGPGSGKSTLFKLLTGIQEAPKESIYFGSTDIGHIPLGTLRKTIAYVPSESMVISTTIRENIAFGTTEEQGLTIEEAAQKSALYIDLEERLVGKKESTTLHEGGTDVSGGQRQRISIGRAFYKNAPYLLLDDSFSALDRKSARHILNHLHREKAQTILCISQRLEVMKEMDYIYVFHQGQIVEEGTHEDLLALKGEYYKQYSLQEKGRTMYE